MNSEQTRKKIKNYFGNHCRNLDDEAVGVIKNSFALCVNYDIPICNLWALQATIQDDRIFVQIPNIYDFKHLLNENTSYCSFDWQLIRPESLDYVKDENVRKWIKKYISGFLYTEESKSVTIVPSWDVNLDGVPEFPDLDDEDEDDIDEWDSVSNQEQFEEDMKRQHHSELELLLYFIVKNVVYGTDEHFNQLQTWALLCLKYLKIQNARRVNEILCDVRSRLSFVYSEKLYRSGFNSVVWDEWKAGKFKSPSIIIDECGDQDFYKLGQDVAKAKFRERFWLEMLKRVFATTEQEKYYFNLYGFKLPQGFKSLSKGDFLQEAEAKIKDLDEKYRLYKQHYRKGWEEEGENEEVRYVVNILFLDDSIVSNETLQNAFDIGMCVHKWFNLWTLKADSFNIGEKIKARLKKMVPIPLLELGVDCSARNDKLKKYLEQASSLLEFFWAKLDPCVNSFNECLEYFGGEDQIKFIKLLSNGFGDYQFALVNGRSVLDAATYSNLIAQKTTWLPLIQSARYEDDEKKAQEIYEIAATLDVRAYLNKAERCFRQGKNDIVYFNAEHKRKLKECREKGWDLEFKGELKKKFISGQNNIKEAIYAYKSAARLGNAVACYEYYQAIHYLKNENGFKDEFEKVFSTHHLDENDRMSVKHDKRVFDKWLGLDNEWVFLRKAYLKKLPKAIQKWNSLSDLYTEKISDQRDGREYTAIFAAGRWWLAEDLKYNVPGVKIQNDKYYYNFQTAQKAIMPGWRLPTRDDYKNLNKWCAKHSVQKNPAGTSLKSIEWRGNNNSKDVIGGTDDFGFAAKPMGLMIDGHENILRNNEVFYWTSAETDETNASCISLSSSDNELGITSMSKDFYLPLRLVREC